MNVWVDLERVESRLHSNGELFLLWTETQLWISSFLYSNSCPFTSQLTRHESSAVHSAFPYLSVSAGTNRRIGEI